MRAPYLPDVGDELMCRFTVPNSDHPVETKTEVVWAQDMGARTGEFGLRFLGLDAKAQSAIEQIIAAQNSYVPPKPKFVSRERIPSGTASLTLDGVPSPILGTVVQADMDGITIEQELPFLRLQRGVTVLENGRRGIVNAVDLVVDGEVPKLVLDVIYTADARPSDDDEMGDDHAGGTDATAEPSPEVSAPIMARAAAAVPLERSLRGVSAEDTIPDTSISASTSTGVVGDFDEDGDEDCAAQELDRVHSVRTQEAPVAHRRERAATRPDSTMSFQVEGHEGSENEADDDLHELAGLRSGSVRFEQGMTALRAWSARAMDVAMVYLAKAWAFALAMTRKYAPIVTDKGSKYARSGFTTARNLGRRGAEGAAQLVRARRKTTEAQFAPNVTPKRGTRHTEPERSSKKGLILGVCAVAVVVGGAVALWPASKEEAADAKSDHEFEPAPTAAIDPLAAEEAARSMQARMPSSAGAGAAAQAAIPAPQPTAAGGTREISLDSLPLPPGDGTAAQQAGPMPAPTFPSPREAIVPSVNPEMGDVSAPAASAQRATVEQEPAVSSGGARFGSASVPGGRTFRLRMSRDVGELRGVSEPDGFVVMIPGALSLDRAGPIAQAHPSLAQSIILNRGDHSELTIRFKPGHLPRYRVEGNGSELIVVIGN
jgi:hypothetical protein